MEVQEDDMVVQEEAVKSNTSCFLPLWAKALSISCTNIFLIYICTLNDECY